MWSCVFTGEKKEAGHRSSACSKSTTMEREVPRGETHKTQLLPEFGGVDEGTWEEDLDVLFIYLS